jgi:DNA repair protein RadD
MFELRPYQRQALDALDAYWRNGGGHPLISMATATGKSLVIAWLIRDLMQRYPNLRILVLTHVQELIKQNVDHVLALWPDAQLGINCAALGRRDLDHPILFASIQSVFRNPKAIGPQRFLSYIAPRQLTRFERPFGYRDPKHLVRPSV